MLQDAHQRGYRYTLICAPAGYGKSCLAWQLALARGVPHCWVGLDERDNQEDRLLAVLCLALRRLLAPLQRQADAATEAPGDGPVPTHACDQLLERLGQRQQTCVLVLDDFHVIQDSAALALCNQLLKHWPDNVMLIITSRQQVPLKFGQAGLQDQLLLLQAEHLQLSQAAIAALLAAQPATDLHATALPNSLACNPDGVATLARQVSRLTNGWPVAVQLALQLLRRSQPLTLKDWMPRYQENIARYFWEQIYADLQPEQRRFLLAAALCERFQADLIGAICDVPDAARQLRTLQAACLIQHSQYQDRHWYRLHALLREFILQELALQPLAQRQAMYQCALDWLTEQRHVEDALILADTHGTPDDLANLLRRYGEQYMDQGGFEFLDVWLTKLPDALLQQDPALLLLRAWTLPEGRKIRLGPALLARIEALCSDTHHAAGMPVRIRALALRAYIARVTNRHRAAAHHSQEAIQLASRYHPALLSRLYTTLGQDHYQKGDGDAAERDLKKALLHGQQHHKVHDVVIALGYLIATLSACGRFDEAHRAFAQVQDWFQVTGYDQLPQARILDDLLIDLYRETGDLARAEALSARMLDYCADTAPALHHLVTHLRRYRLALSRHDLAGAGQALVEAEAFQDLLGVSWAFGWAPVVALRAEYALLCGRPAQAQHWFNTRAARLQQADQFADEGERFVLAAWYRAQGKPDAALAELARIANHAQRQHRSTNLIRAWVLQALVLAPSDADAACQVLADALTLSAGQGYCATFLDAGPELLPLLGKVRAWVFTRPAVVQQLDFLLAQARMHWPAQASKAGENRLAVLSDRQRDILRLLVNGDQDKVIARKLGITLGTVKTHLRAIYRKLACSNRAQAVAIALEDGLTARH